MTIQIGTDQKVDYSTVALVLGAMVLVVAVGTFVGIWSASKAA